MMAYSPTPIPFPGHPFSGLSSFKLSAFFHRNANAVEQPPLYAFCAGTTSGFKDQTSASAFVFLA